MRKDSQEYLKRLSLRDLSIEYKCINGLQNTGFKINEDILSVMRPLWNRGHEVAGLPPRENLDLPPYPFQEAPENLLDHDVDRFKTWKKTRKEIYDFNNRSTSKRIQVERTLQVAEEYSRYPAFWYVWQLDFRGRKYPVSDNLSPQSADWGKALLTFSEGVEVTTEDDVVWLAIHGANCFGIDRDKLVDRELWVALNQEKIVQVAAKPFEFKWWQEADEPWQFLAFCFEWSNYLRIGLGFITHLPCAADGSCNGLQHLSAILRDEKGGKAVNLIPNHTPQDIYSDVAASASLGAWADAETGNVLAQQILEFGIDRKICKRPVMIVPYSGTLYACRDYIIEAVNEKLNGAEPPWGNNHNGAMTYLSQTVWNSIDGVIVSASKVMNYLKCVGKTLADENKPLEWVTPTNFLVRQAYPDLKKHKIKTHIDGNVIKLNFQKASNNTVCKQRASNGASPNFIHSLDAAALTLTVNECLDQGIKSFAMIHDSYGTHSPNMPRLSRVLREQFVKMYEDHDVLEDFREYVSSSTQVVIPEPPTKGSLDIKKVLESEYFFS